MEVRHKQTRKEKIAADFNRQVYILKNNNMPLEHSTALTTNKDSSFNTHVIRDILKTGILTSSIIAAEIILFFLLKNHIISIPNLNY